MSYILLHVALKQASQADRTIECNSLTEHVTVLYIKIVVMLHSELCICGLYTTINTVKAYLSMIQVCLTVKCNVDNKDNFFLVAMIHLIPQGQNKLLM